MCSSVPPEGNVGVGVLVDVFVGVGVIVGVCVAVAVKVGVNVGFGPVSWNVIGNVAGKDRPNISCAFTTAYLNNAPNLCPAMLTIVTTEEILIKSRLFI